MAKSGPDEATPRDDSIIEGYRQVWPMAPIALDSDSDLGERPDLAVVVHSDDARPVQPRHRAMDVVRKWVGLAIVAAIIFTLGFAGGSIFMGREAKKAIAAFERDRGKMVENVNRDRIELIGAAQNQIALREMMLEMAGKQIAKLTGENAWLQRKLSDFTRTSL